MGEQLGRDLLGVDDEVLGGAAAARGRGDDRVDVREDGRERVLHGQEVLLGDALGSVADGPAAGRRERDDAARAAAGGELQRDVAAERVADEVRGGEAGVVHGRLDGVDERVLGRVARERRTARMTSECQRENIVLTLQRGQYELPGAPRVRESVQAHQWRPLAAAMQRCESKCHRDDASGGARGSTDVAWVRERHEQIPALSPVGRRGRAPQLGGYA